MTDSEDTLSAVISSNNTSQGKCPSCGGIITYSPERELLHCEHCGTDIKLDLKPAEVKENDFLEWSKHPEMLQAVETVVAEVRCAQCGAHTTFPENTSSFECAFCGTPIVLKTAVQRRAWKPEYMLPFRIGKKAGKESFRKWASSRWFAPSGFAGQLDADGRLKGVYLPYWTYDADTQTDYRGERGDSRTTSRMVNGKFVTQTYTEWSAVSGRVEYNFDDVIVPASDSIPPDIASVLTNWDKKKYVLYNEQFEKGFLTELYKHDFLQSYPAAKRQMDAYISALVRAEIGGSQQRVHHQQTSYDNVKFKLILLPVWLSAYRYKNKSYLFAINGRTGQVVGRRPWSIVKIMLLILAIAAVLVVIFNL